jgi:hypothetical protein
LRDQTNVTGIGNQLSGSMSRDKRLRDVRFWHAKNGLA